MKAIIYCRVSSERQVVEGHGLEGQEKRCRDYARNLGYKIIAVFRDEGVSGGLIDRPGMQRLLEKLEEYKNAPEKTVVIFDDIKRFARDVQGHFTLKTAIYSRNAVLESPSHRFEDTPEGKFIETMLAGHAELERNQNKRQVINRMKSRAEMGYWPFMLPPGLVNQKHPRHGKIAVPDEPIATVFRLAIEGYRDRILLTQQDVVAYIQKEYEMHGINRKISLHGVQRLLTEILYTGWIEYEPWGISRRKAQFDGFISLETYEEVQQILSDRTKPKIRRDTNPEFPLRGLIVCSLCRKPLTASFNTGHSGQRYPNYFCKNPGCPLQNKIIHRSILEEDFLGYLETVKLGNTTANLALAVLNDVWNNKQKQFADEQRSQEYRKQDIENSINSMTTRIRKTTDEALIRVYESDLKKLLEEKDALDTTRIPSRYTQEQFGTASRKVLSVLENPADTWKTGSLGDRLAVYFMHFDQKPVYDRELKFGTAILAQSVDTIRSLGSEKNHSVEMPGNEPGSESIHRKLLQA